MLFYQPGSKVGAMDWTTDSSILRLNFQRKVGQNSFSSKVHGGWEFCCWGKPWVKGLWELPPFKSTAVGFPAWCHDHLGTVTPLKMTLTKFCIMIWHHVDSFTILWNNKHFAYHGSPNVVSPTMSVRLMSVPYYVSLPNQPLTKRAFTTNLTKPNLTQPTGPQRMFALPNPAGHVSPFQTLQGMFLGTENSRWTVIRRTVIIGKVT